MPENNTFYIVLAVLTAMFITAYSIPVIINAARLKGLIDTADSKRKIHVGKIPTLGGVGIFIGIIMAYSIWINNHVAHFYPYLIASLILVFAIGIKDDILVIAPRKKFFLQFLAVVILVVLGGVRLVQVDGMFGLFQELAPSFVITLSIFVFLVIVNSFNLIDGIDGLCGSQALLATLILGLWFYINGHMGETLLAAATTGAILGFLYHNKPPAKIFMGDTGSLIIGFIMATLALRMIKLNGASTVWVFEKPTMYAFAAMVIPMFDTFRVIFLRLINGDSPFRADGRHVHHCLLKFGYGHAGISIILFAAGILIMYVAYRINAINIHYTLLILLGLCLLILPAAWFAARLRQKYREKKLRELFRGSDFVTEVIKPCLLGDMDNKPPEQEKISIKQRKIKAM